MSVFRWKIQLIAYEMKRLLPVPLVESFRTHPFDI